MRKFKKQYINENRSYIDFKPIGGVLHESADPGATAQNEYGFFNNHPNLKKSVHAFVDWLEDLQLIPWNERAGHAKPQANKRFIGLEMCRPENDDPKKLEKMLITYEAAVDAFARLFFYVLKIKKVTKENLMSHHEVSLKWKESTHTDPTSYLKEIGKTMDGFRADVQKRLELMK